MRKRSRIRNLSLCLGGFALAGGAQHVYGQITVDGTLDSNYGAAVTTQTINTGFGNSTVGDGTSLGGSELDAGYATVQNGTLYLFLSGNLESAVPANGNNANHLNIFIADGRTGQTTLAAGSSGNLSAMNGSTFMPGFSATYALDFNDYEGTLYTDQYDLVHNTSNYLGAVPLTGGVGNSQNVGGLAIGFNNTNVSAQGTTPGAATDPTAADGVKTGLEVGIPLAALGDPAAGSSIQILADINGGGDGFLSNQFLGGLPVGTANVGSQSTPFSVAGNNSAFNLSSEPADSFTVTVPSLPNGTWIATGSGAWNSGPNWANGYIPHLAGDNASFATATAPSTVTLGGAYTVGSLSFSDSNSYEIAAGTGGVLTLNNGTSTAAITDYAGIHSISAPVVLASNGSVAVISHGDTFTISGNISGTGSLTTSSPGGGSPVILSGTNTYGGGTIVQAGNLQLNSAGALPTGTALTLSALDLPAGNLDLNGNNANVSSITVLTGSQTGPTGAVAQIINTSTVAATSTLTYAGTLANPSTFNGNIVDSTPNGGTGGITALTVASGSLTLSGSNSYGGTTTINPGATLDLSFVVPQYTPTISLPTGGNVTNNGSLVVDSAVIIAGTISGSGTTTVNAAGVISAIGLSQAGGLVNNGSTTVLTGGTVGPISGLGTLTIGGTLALAHNSGASSQGVLTLNPGATLDINNNHFFINYGAAGQSDPISTIISDLNSGFAGGTWTGTGITSSAAAANSGSYGVGYADSADPGNPAGLDAAGQIEIKYTLLGDANLDGAVNGTDFAILAANFNKADQVGFSGWDEGDFNYDGSVNGTDFAELAGNFNKGASQASDAAGDVAALDAFAAANGFLADVPEPATTGLLLFGGLGVLMRRRRAGLRKALPAS